MQKERKIIHIDMDCFFAAVEVKHNPELLKKPIAVGGRAENRGVIATASYEARKYGVKSAMPTALAFRKCPDLILLHPNFSLYKEESRKVFEIFKRYTNKIEPLSIDEAFLDVSQSELPQGSATYLAREIRHSVLKEVGLTCSAGVASNKFLAKICSDLKKPNGQFTLDPSENLKFTSLLPVEKIFGVGPRTKEKMHSLNLKTCADLQKLELFELQRHFGSFGSRLYHLSRGVDEREVKNNRIRKSFSREITFAKDIETENEILDALKRVYTNFNERFNNSAYKDKPIKNISFKIKFHDFQTKTKDIADSKVPSLTEAKNLFLNFWHEDPKSLRLIGFGVRFDTDSSQEQMLFNLDL